LLLTWGRGRLYLYLTDLPFHFIKLNCPKASPDSSLWLISHRSLSPWGFYRYAMADRKAEYHKYLKSTTWKLLRSQRLELDRGKCVMCYDDATQVHHRRYPRVLGTESIFYLSSVCRGCHEKHHKTHPKYYEISEMASEHIRGIKERLNA